MIELKFETKTVHTIKDNDWDSFIKETFPNSPYEGICCEEELKNDSTFSHMSEKVNIVERVKVRKYFDGETDDENIISTGDIINCLVTEMFLPEGLYNINIYW